jgi:hypothetical protein
MRQLSPAQASILELIELTGVCTQRHLVTWTRTTRSYISQVVQRLTDKLLVQSLGRVVGPDAIHLPGVWLQARNPKSEHASQRELGAKILTNQNRPIHRHPAYVSQTLCHCSEIFPNIRFVPETALRKQGWFYKNASSVPAGVANPLATYVPDALLNLNGHFIRLEVQTHFRFSCAPEEMIAACADTYPIIMVATHAAKLSAGAAPHFPRLQIVPFGDLKALESALRLAVETPS